MEEVQAALAGCYDAFGRYRFEGGCLEAADGIGPLEKRLLRVTPPAEIPLPLLMAYVASLPPSLSGRVADDVRAVLPRLFALAADGAVSLAIPRDIAERADFRAEWPEAEVAAIARCLAALADGVTEPLGVGAG